MQERRMRQTVGIDLAKRTMTVRRLRTDGKVQRFFNKMTPAGRQRLMSWLEADDLVVLEAGNQAFELAKEIMANTKAKVLVLNPGAIALIYKSLKKTDPEDALKLARLAQAYSPEELPTVTIPTDEEMQALLFAWRIAKHVKSNAIVYTLGDRTLGIGAGQMSRVDSSKIAGMKAAEAGFDLHGCAVSSDAYFPFADGLMEAIKVGATAVIQPGGSVRDDEVIKAADEHDVAMVFTGIRHFRH